MWVSKKKIKQLENDKRRLMDLVNEAMPWTWSTQATPMVRADANKWMDRAIQLLAELEA